MTFPLRAHFPSPFGRGAGGEGWPTKRLRIGDYCRTALTLTLSQREREPVYGHALRTFPRAAVILAVLGWAGYGTESKEPRTLAASPAQSISSPQKGELMNIAVTSAAFHHGERIPKKYTGEGQDVSPPISWDNVPPGTKELVLICDDPDAPTPEPWVHWVIYKIPTIERGLPEGTPRDARLKKPAKALQGKNSWPSDNIGYRGPMPPPGHGTHHYYFRVYAIGAKLPVEPGMDKRTLLQEIAGHAIAEGVLMGTYQR
jgi:Raf kinase inhibitor-like YbhB/YbcL family protein